MGRSGGILTSLISGYRGLVLGIAVGLVIAGIPAAVPYSQVTSLQGQNSNLNRSLADARSRIANGTSEAANDTRLIGQLEFKIGNLTSELQVLRRVVNFSAVRVIWNGNLTIAKNRGYGYGVGAPDATMSTPGSIAVLFRGGLVNATSTSVQAHVEIHFINKSVNWSVQPQPQVILVSYLPPMGGIVVFVNDGTPTVWVNYQILYLT